MSTLTYSHGDLAGSTEAARKPATKPLWKRLFEAVLAARQRRAEREVALYLKSHGGLMTDDMEREIMLRLSGNHYR